MKHFRNNFLFYILSISVIVIGVITYYRFMVNHDYIVGYEGECDPATAQCFMGCEDDACTEEYYYSLMQKYAVDLRKECGNDITDCETANICLPEDRFCSITYCDAEMDGATCETFTEEPNMQGEPAEESSLQGNEKNNINI
ncbi:MAG: hypothetical protein WA060_01390 [Minisyncoccia bacterium]